MSMASSSSTASGSLHLEALPLVDLRFLSQSELQALSLTSSHSSDLRFCDDVVIPKIDRSIFNESAGSRKQTYSRLRLAPRKPDIAAPITGRPRFTSHLNQKAAPEPVDEENSLIIGLLKGLFATETHADDLIPVQVQYKESSNEVLQNIPIDVVTDSGKKRKRGRPKRDKTVAVYQNGGTGEYRSTGIVNNNGVVVDFAALANAEDPFGPELRRRTEGLNSAAALLGFLTGLDGQWGSRRKKRKIVEASDFGDVLPKGWKLLLSMKRKDGRVWLFCRRYISPNGQQFVSFKEVSSYLLSAPGLHDTRQPNYGHNDGNIQSAYQVAPRNVAGLTLRDDKSNGAHVCFPPTTSITTVSTPHEKQATLSRMGKSGEVKVGEVLNCHKCTMTFVERDDLLYHLSSSHNETASSCKLGSCISEKVIMREGKYECQFCHEIFHEESSYKSHVGVHGVTFVKNAEVSVLMAASTSLDGLIWDCIGKTSNGQFNDGINSHLTHCKPNAGSITETYNNFNNSLFDNLQHSGIATNDGTCVEESVDKQDKDCNLTNDKLGKVHEVTDSLATKTNLFGSETALSDNETRSIQKASAESSVIKCPPAAGINDFCGREERISESPSVAPSRNEQTHEAEANVSGVSTSLKKEPRQGMCYESGLTTPNDKEESGNTEIIEDRLLSSTTKEMRVDCKDKFGQHEPIFDFRSSVNHDIDIAINVKQQRISDGCHLPVPFLNKQKSGFVNNLNGVLASPMVESNQEGVSKSGLLTLLGKKQTYGADHNSSWVSTGTYKPKLDEVGHSGNNELTFGFDSNHTKPNEDAATHVEWEISSGSNSPVGSWKDQTCFKNNTNCVSTGPLEKGSESGGLTPSCKEQICGFENNGNKVSIGTVEEPKFNEINNSRNSELITTSSNMNNAGVHLDVTSVETERVSQGYFPAFPRNEHKFGIESIVPVVCNSTVGELKLGGHSESSFCNPSDKEQKSGIGNDLKISPGRVWQIPRFREMENPNNTELMIGFGTSHAQPGLHVMPEAMWRTDEENVLQSALAHTSSSMVHSSGCFPTFNMISAKGGNGLCSTNEKFNSGPSYERLKSDGTENLKLNSLTAQRSSLSENSKLLSYDTGIQEGFNSSDWLGKETLLPKVASGHLVATACIWCRNEFYHETVHNAMQTSSVGFMCPSCKVKFSGGLNLF